MPIKRDVYVLWKGYATTMKSLRSKLGNVRFTHELKFIENGWATFRIIYVKENGEKRRSF